VHIVGIDMTAEPATATTSGAVPDSGVEVGDGPAAGRRGLGAVECRGAGAVEHRGVFTVHSTKKKKNTGVYMALVLCGAGSREVFGHLRLAGPTDYTHFRGGSCWLLRGITGTELSASGLAGF
jgi:hypothetical protein